MIANSGPALRPPGRTLRLAQALVAGILALALVPPAAPAKPPDAAAQLKKMRELRPGSWLELQGTNKSAVFPTREQTTWGGVGPAS